MSTFVPRIDQVHVPGISITVGPGAVGSGPNTAQDEAKNTSPIIPINDQLHVADTSTTVGLEGVGSEGDALTYEKTSM
jgi:hypothetical protein